MTMSDDPRQVDLARAAREELAVAHYFGARLLRLAGEPAKTWRAEALKARQHFRFLAETAAESGASPELVRGLEDNVERTIELEQMDKSDLEGRPLPRESPQGTRGRRPGRDARNSGFGSWKPWVLLSVTSLHVKPGHPLTTVTPRCRTDAIPTKYRRDADVANPRRLGANPPRDAPNAAPSTGTA